MDGISTGAAIFVLAMLAVCTGISFYLIHFLVFKVLLPNFRTQSTDLSYEDEFTSSEIAR